MLEDVPVADLVSELTRRLDVPLDDAGSDVARQRGSDEVDLLVAAERLARHADWLRLRRSSVWSDAAGRPRVRPRTGPS